MSQAIVISVSHPDLFTPGNTKGFIKPPKTPLEKYLTSCFSYPIINGVSKTCKTCQTFPKRQKFWYILDILDKMATNKRGAYSRMKFSQKQTNTREDNINQQNTTNLNDVVPRPRPEVQMDVSLN